MLIIMVNNMKPHCFVIDGGGQEDDNTDGDASDDAFEENLCFLLWNCIIQTFINKLYIRIQEKQRQTSYTKTFSKHFNSN